MTWRPAPQSYYLDGTTPKERLAEQISKLDKRVFTDPTKQPNNKTFYTKPITNEKGIPQHLVGGYSIKELVRENVGTTRAYADTWVTRIGYFVAEHGATVKKYSRSDYPAKHQSTVGRTLAYYLKSKKREQQFFNWSDLPNLEQRDKTNPHFNRFSSEFQRGACIENSFATALIWWDSLGIINLTKYGFKNREEICEYLVLKNTSNLAALNWGTLKDKIEKFAENQLKEDFKFYYREKELNFKTLHQECSHNQAVMLGVTLVIDEGYFSHGISVISATPTGEIEFQSWGERYKAQIMTKRVKGYYPIKIISGTLPEWYTEKDVNLVISRSGKAIKIIRPLIKVKEGIVYRKPFADIRDKK